MLPLGHLAFAYLWYVVTALVRRRPIPASLALVPLAVGSQFPDLVDKPLAYYEVVTYGRAVGHSLVTFVVLSVLVWWVVHRYADVWPAGSWQAVVWRRTPLAFSVGVLSHIVGDGWAALLRGDLYAVRWLLWPLYQMPAVPADDIPPLTRLVRIWSAMEHHPDLHWILLAGLVFGAVRVLAWALGRRTLRQATTPDSVRAGD